MYNIKDLRDSGRKPRVHPNGFVQFDTIPGEERLHVWPASGFINSNGARMHPVHNHSYDIESEVLCGCVTNLTYLFIAKKPTTHQLHRATRTTGHDSVLVPMIGESEGHLVSWTSHTYLPGDSYKLDRDVLHDTLTHGLTATLMKIKNPDQTYGPLVAVPWYLQPNNDFKREEVNVREEYLWHLIDEALMRAKYIKYAYEQPA